jgi:hypothetical protein
LGQLEGLFEKTYTPKLSIMLGTQEKARPWAGATINDGWGWGDTSVDGNLTGGYFLTRGSQ